MPRKPFSRSICFPTLVVLAAALTVAPPALTAVTRAAGEADEEAMSEELAAHQKLIDAVESAYRYFLAPTEGRQTGPETFYDAAIRLVSLGDDVLPFLENELSLERKNRTSLAFYALGLLGSPGAEMILRNKISELEERPGKTARRLHMWACYSLALQGHTDAVHLLNSGRHLSGKGQIFAGIPTVAVAAMLTAPDSRDLLIDEIRKLRGAEPDEDSERNLIRTALAVDALGYVADRSTVPFLVSLLDEENGVVRYRTIRALTRIDHPDALDVFIAAVENDSNSLIRQTAAAAIERILPAQQSNRIREILAAGGEPFERGCLYRTLARVGGEEEVETLMGYWGAADRDRKALVEALGSVPGTRTHNLIHRALSDSRQEVALAAVDALDRIGNPRSVDTLLELVGDHRWNIARVALDHLVERGETRAGARAADRLIHREIPSTAPPIRRRTPIRILGNALVSLRHVEPRETLRPLVEQEKDPQIREFLQDVVRRLDLIAARGDRVKPWIQDAESADRETRHLSYRRLAEIGSRKAQEALIRLFTGADPEDRAEIVHSLGILASGSAAPLLERILLDPEFDRLAAHEIRSMAAWAAHRIGTPEMAGLLRKSVERRNGRDLLVLLAMASLEGEAALPTLHSVRDGLYRYMSPHRFEEQHLLDEVIFDLEAGRTSPTLTDLPLGIHDH